MHPDEAALWSAVAAAPADADGRLVLADWLDERDDPRGELLRLTFALTRPGEVPGRAAMEARQRQLLADGVGPPTHVLVNSVGMALALVPPGTFLMGSPDDEPGRRADEGPQRTVTITRAFYLGVDVVSRAELFALAGPADASDMPAGYVSWAVASAFCARLSAVQSEVAAGRFYRLPTEAEWEYACRAGTTSPFFWGERLPPGVARYDTGGPVPCGSLPPNAFGLRGMHGNVWEWCADWYGPYPPGPAADPTGPVSGTEYVVRGGSWAAGDYDCRSASRGRLAPVDTDDDVGFRVVLEVRG